MVFNFKEIQLHELMSNICNFGQSVVYNARFPNIFTWMFFFPCVSLLDGKRTCLTGHYGF